MVKMVLGIACASMLTGCAANVATTPAAQDGAHDVTAHAEELAQKLLIVDGHIDVPYRLQNGKNENGSNGNDGSNGHGGFAEDVSNATEKGDFDYPRARRGGLDAPFMSIYVPAKLQKEGGGKALADSLIDDVEKIAQTSDGKFTVARSVDGVRENFTAGRMSLLLGIENGAAIEGEPDNLKHFYERGVRYITLTHSEDNAICDSSYAETRTHKGLSAVGREVVAAMNALGMMIDISHVSDDAFYQVAELSKAPLIASHSSARHFTPGFERNMDDAMIRKLAAGGGVIMINFGSSFISQKSRDYYDARREAIKAEQARLGVDGRDDPRIKAFIEAYREKHPPVYATVEDVADHIDHVVKLVGVDHVGLGSDFDGVGDSLPVGLKDVAAYPNLFAVLLKRGYTEDDLRKIAGENLMRVWSAVEAYAAQKP